MVVAAEACTYQPWAAAPDARGVGWGRGGSGLAVRFTKPTVPLAMCSCSSMPPSVRLTSLLLLPLLACTLVSTTLLVALQKALPPHFLLN